MRLILVMLVLAAILVSLLASGVLIVWLRGADSFFFPGLGFVITTPLLAVLLLVGEILIILFAMFTQRLASHR